MWNSIFYNKCHFRCTCYKNLFSGFLLIEEIGGGIYQVYGEVFWTWNFEVLLCHASSTTTSLTLSYYALALALTDYNLRYTPLPPQQGPWSCDSFSASPNLSTSLPNASHLSVTGLSQLLPLSPESNKHASVAGLLHCFNRDPISGVHRKVITSSSW